MGTRSYIGILNADDTVDYVYCHWDGSPSHRLPILREFYNNAAAVRKLLSKGSMSHIRTGESWDGSARPLGPLYYIERGDNCEKLHTGSPFMFAYGLKQSDCEYAYLFVPRGRTLGVFKQDQGWNYCDVRTL